MTSRFKAFCLPAAAAITACFGVAASAQSYTSYFNNNAQFKADLGTTVEVEDFENPGTFTATEGSPVVFTKTGTMLSFINSDADNGFIDAIDTTSGATSGVTAVAFNGGDMVTFTFPEAVVGFAIDINGLQNVATPSTFIAAFGAQVAPVRFAATDLHPGNSFNFGVISDTAFTSVTLGFGTGGDNAAFAGGDLVNLDTLEFAPVPEPATLVLITLGLATTLTGRRRRD